MYFRLMNGRLQASLLFLVCASACGLGAAPDEPDAPKTVIDAVVQGQPLHMRYGISTDMAAMFDHSRVEFGVGIGLVSAGATCESLQLSSGEGNSPNSTLLMIALAKTDDAGRWTPVTPGDYRISTRDTFSTSTTTKPPISKNAAGAFLLKFNSSGKNVFENHDRATFGTIHVESGVLGPNETIVGTVDLLFGTEKVKGTFAAPFCAL